MIGGIDNSSLIILFLLHTIVYCDPSSDYLSGKAVLKENTHLNAC